MHEIAKIAAAVARDLKAAKALPHEPVMLVVSNEPRDLIGFLGVWLGGCVAVPVHSATPPATADALIVRVGARFSVKAGALCRIPAAPAPPSRPLLDGAALIVFTSGSTGRPKGVVIGHEALLIKLRVLADLLAFTSKDIVAAPLQLTFIFGLWVSLLTLMSGASLRLTPKFSRQSLKESIAGTSVLAAVPTILRGLCENEPVIAPSLRKILTGGEAFSPSLANRLALVFPDALQFDLYGLTETGSCDFCLRPNDLPVGLGTIGRPTAGVTFRIVAGPESLDAGSGELQICSPSRMLGYLDDVEMTTNAFCDDFFKTGDLATARSDGFVQLVGRTKDIISRGGNKIAPLEIDHLFARHPDVAAVMAFGVPDERLGESLHVMIVRRGPTLDEQSLRDWAASRIERFKLPDRFHFVEELPLGRTGKADRSAARGLVVSGMPSRT